MFSKVMAGTVTREEGAMFLNHLGKENLVETGRELAVLVETPPPGVFSKTILHTIALSRNKAFHNILVENLVNKNEELSMLAASEMARLRNEEAKNVLTEHLNNDVYHVRKASAMALLTFEDGIEILRRHITTHPEPFYRLTSAQALLQAGRKGIECLLTVLNSDNQGAVITAADVLIKTQGGLEEIDAARIFEALMNAGDKKDSQPASIVELLKVAASLKEKARGYEGYVMAFADHPSKSVRKEAAKTLSQIRAALSE